MFADKRFHTTVPAPRPIALCEDESVLGVPFYLMEHVRGAILRRVGGEIPGPQVMRGLSE